MGNDPLATLLLFLQEVIPLPPFDVWLRDRSENLAAHLEEEFTSAPAHRRVSPPVMVESRGMRLGEAPWRASLSVFRRDEAWRGFISFRIGGGRHAGRTCMNLLVGGKVVRSAVGENTETLISRWWDVSDLRGKEGVLEIVDNHTGGWGHVLVDQIVFTDTGPPADKLATEEIFGPVLSVITVASAEEAVEVANASDYGLTASVFTANAKRAIRAARAVRAGTVTVNCYGEGDIATPFGGYKQSGFGGRDNSVHAHDQFTELKTIWIDLTDPAAEDNIA